MSREYRTIDNVVFDDNKFYEVRTDLEVPGIIYQGLELSKTPRSSLVGFFIGMPLTMEEIVQSRRSA